MNGDLIARLEAAAEGSKELDWEIAGKPLWEYPPNDRRPNYNNPLYTTSLDAALTLVPEGLWGGKIMWNGSERANGGYVELECGPVSEGGVWAALVNSYDAEDDREEIPKPKPLALALCIAALKARRVAT
jgi:hypothetical protein